MRGMYDCGVWGVGGGVGVYDCGVWGVGGGVGVWGTFELSKSWENKTFCGPNKQLYKYIFVYPIILSFK